mgnify:CR=1 FL=1
MTNTSAADMKMKQLSKKFRVTGLTAGALSGLTYGIYTTLVLVAGYYEPLVSAVGILAAPYVCSGLNDLFAGIWLTIYNAKKGRLAEIGRTANTFPGKMMILGALLGGPIANGAYLVGLALAGAYAIPISATCGLFRRSVCMDFLKAASNQACGSRYAYLCGRRYHHQLGKTGRQPELTLGIICALIAAVCWGLEGMLSSYGGAMIDTDVATNIRQLFSGLVDLVIIVPLVGGLGLLGGTMSAGIPALWLAVSGLSAGASFLLWYKANSTVGCAIGMSLNVTYAFWGVLFCILFLGQPVTTTIVVGSVVIIFGAILVTMNPLDFFKKGEV